jgi:hypothetical protein
MLLNKLNSFELPLRHITWNHTYTVYNLDLLLPAHKVNVFPCFLGFLAYHKVPPWTNFFTISINFICVKIRPCLFTLFSDD